MKPGDLAPLDMVVAVGFGCASILADNELLLDGELSAPPKARRNGGHRGGMWRRSMTSWRIGARHRRYLTLDRVERYLMHRERSGAPVSGVIECQIVGPMWQATWVREAPGRWVCTSTGEGFA